MKVLVGCEESGVVSAAFRARGHDAYSCDVLPTRGDPTHHYTMDIMTLMESALPNTWDIIILHPPCTYLAVPGNRWYGKGTAGHPKRLQAIEWTTRLWRLAISRARIGVALENPVSVLFTTLGVTQYIQPWQFGHGEVKKTGLLLDRLPALEPTCIVDGREQRVWRMGPSETRSRDRSVTYHGIADAMADQWGSMI